MELIDSKYRVLRTLGKGGLGVVFVCWSEALNKEVAVKVLHDQVHSSINMARFRKEAQSLALCKHPCIVQSLSFGVAAEGNPYLVMDYLPGISLAAELNERGPLSPPRFARIFKNILSALECAHEAGLVHRDLKPSNILLTETTGQEKAVLIDFGLIKQLDGQKLTATAALLGTPQYMSPEQCQGQNVDIRSDLYALGCTMYEAATGRPPFEGDAMEILWAHLHTEPQGIPTVLAPLLGKLLAKDRSDRFANAAEASACLDSLNLASIEDFKSTSQPAGRVSKKLVGADLRRKLLTAALVISPLLVGALGLSVYLQEKVKPEPTKTEIRARAQALFQQAMDERKAGHYEQALLSCQASMQELSKIQREDSIDMLWSTAMKLELRRQLGIQSIADLADATQALKFAYSAHNAPDLQFHFNVERAWQLHAQRQDQAATETYKAGIQQFAPDDKHEFGAPKDELDKAKALYNYGKFRELVRQDPKETVQVVQRACLLLEACRQRNQPEGNLEAEANELLICYSNDRAQLRATGERMRQAAQNSLLSKRNQALYLVAAGLAFSKSGDKAAALPLLRRVTDNFHGEKAPYTVVCHAVHAILGEQLLQDPKEKIKLARIAYEHLLPFRKTQSGPFAVSASYLASTLQADGQYQDAANHYREAASVAKDLADAGNPSVPGVVEQFNKMSTDNYLQMGYCSLSFGNKADATTALTFCQQLVKKLSGPERDNMQRQVDKLSEKVTGKSE